MFFSSRKKKKLAEETQRKAQEEAQRQEILAYNANLETFYTICDMVRSLPKKRQIVVVQRKNTFKNDQDRNWCYLKLAKKMLSQYRAFGLTWISSDDGSLYAFYLPDEMTFGFDKAILEFSKGAYRIQHIRYYHFNY